MAFLMVIKTAYTCRNVNMVYKSGTRSNVYFFKQTCSWRTSSSFYKPAGKYQSLCIRVNNSNTKKIFFGGYTERNARNLWRILLLLTLLLFCVISNLYLGCFRCVVDIDNELKIIGNRLSFWDILSDWDLNFIQKFSSC